MLGAVREQILVPDVVAYVVEQALARVAEGIGPDRERDGARLEALEGEIERAIDLGVRMGGLDAVARKLEALQREHEETRERLATAPPELPNHEDLRQLIEARVVDFRAAFEAEPVVMRRAIRALLGERRLAVRADPERGFCVEGLVGLPLMHETPGISQVSGRLPRSIAGTCCAEPGLRACPNP